MHSLQLLTLPRNASSEQLADHTLQEQENAKALCSVSTTFLFFSTGFHFVALATGIACLCLECWANFKKEKGKKKVMSASSEFTQSHSKASKVASWRGLK